MSPLVRIFFPLFFILTYNDCIAQSPEIMKALTNSDSSRTVFYLPAHRLVGQVEWRDSIYMFPSFEEGQVTLATGYLAKGQVRMNYNLYHMQMDYINSQGDTLQIKPSEELKLIAINHHLFLHDIKFGYIEIIMQLPVALGAKYMMQTGYIDYPPGGLYRKEGSAPFFHEDQRGAANSLDRYYVKECDYFFIGKDNRAYKATFASASKLFREHKKAVRSYINEHEVDFENREHLTNLLTFCNGLNR